MPYDLLESIEILDDNKIFSERESGVTHTPYETETMFFSLIKHGNVEGVKNGIEQLLSSNKIVAGRLSEDTLRQTKYWAVCCVTLATRYAVQGGLDETAAFNFSDECIMKIDVLKSSTEILAFLKDRCIELTKLVFASSHTKDCPYAVKKCVHYINTNLHNRLSLDILAKECGISPDYLSVIFKKYMKLSVSQYIKKQRLNTARDMLNGKYSCSDVAYYLGFCSESYFIKCFKEEFGITPAKYASSLSF